MLGLHEFFVAFVGSYINIVMSLFFINSEQAEVKVENFNVF